MEKNNIVIIGTSPIVDFHINALKKVGLNIIAVASSNTKSSSHESFARKNDIKKSYSNWNQMLENEEYDGIVVASRIESTEEILNTVINYNVPTLVEKPISFNSNIILKLKKKSHKKIIVGYNRRFYKTTQVIKDLINVDRIPTISTMIVPEFPSMINFFDNSVHSIDLLRYIFGEIKIEYVKKLLFNGKLNGFVSTFSTSNNDIIQFIGNWGASENFSLTTYKGKLKMELKPYEELSTFNGMDIIEPSKKNPIRKYIPKIKNKIQLEGMDRELKPGFFQQSKKFYDLINNIENNTSATLDDAQKATKICEKLIGKFNELKK